MLYLCAWCPQRKVHVRCHGTKITRECVPLCRYWDCSWGLCKNNSVLSLLAISPAPQAILDFSNLSIAKEFTNYQLWIISPCVSLFYILNLTSFLYSFVMLDPNFILLIFKSFSLKQSVSISLKIVYLAYWLFADIIKFSYMYECPYSLERNGIMLGFCCNDHD